jgi:hypothetical protein
MLTQYNKISINFDKNKIKYIVYVLLGILSFFYLKNIFIVAIFILIDFSASYFKHVTHIDAPFDAIVLGIIILSLYNYSISVIILLLVAMIANRMIYGRITPRHIIKLFILIFIAMICYLVSPYRSLEILVIIYVVRFIIEHILVYFLLSEHLIHRIPNQFIQVLLSYLILNAFNVF